MQQYSVITNSSLVELISEVNVRLTKGWKVSGSLITYELNKTLYYAQAVTFN